MASIDDVARATGVSTATVSRALRGLSSVAAPTRARVQVAAHELGYVPSAAAASLASGRTRAIGLVTPHVSRWFFAVCIETIEAVARTHGHDVLLVILPPAGQSNPASGSALPPARPMLDADLLRKRVDATVVLTLPLIAQEVEILQGLGHDLVYVGSIVPGVHSVGIDDVEVGRKATKHLLGFGHRDIRFVGSSYAPADWVAPQDRCRGYLEAMTSAGLTARDPVPADLSVEEGRRTAVALLAEGTLPTAIVCASDELAIGLMHELRTAGVTIPQQVSVIGVDDHPHADLHGLSTIVQPVAEQAMIAARWLLGSLAHRSSTRLLQASTHAELLPTTLLLRSSTAAPRPGS